ncbi:MAG: hypothetical protein M1269_07260 [Chloroflexi bacterium]|nr:hypothetical protein [Chloroflexota bacterium]
MNCPRCSSGSGEGFLCLEKTVKVKFTVITFSAVLNIIYCPRCGLLKFSMAGLHAESVN